MKQSLTAAVVGTGFIGPVHVEGLRRAGIHVAGIAGSTPEKSRQAAAQLGIERAYQTFEEVLADSSVDSIHLATPNRLHFEQATAALRAGKHVLCEKPLAMNVKESAELVRLARASDLVTGVAYNIRFYPLCQESATRVQSAEFGDFLHVQGSYVQDWLLFDTDFNWRVSADDGGQLRAVADIGTHWLDLAQFITGQQVESVFAELQTVHKQRQRPVAGATTFSGQDPTRQTTEKVTVTTEDAGCVLLKFDNGAHGSLFVSQTSAGRKNCLRFEIAGSRQSMAWNSELPNTLWIGHRNRPNESLTRDATLLGDQAAQYTNYPGGHNEGFPDTFKQLFRSFYGYIAAGDFTAKKPFPSFEDGHREVLLCEAILRSHHDKTWVSIGDHEQ